MRSTCLSVCINRCPTGFQQSGDVHLDLHGVGESGAPNPEPPLATPRRLDSIIMYIGVSCVYVCVSPGSCV